MYCRQDSSRHAMQKLPARNAIRRRTESPQGGLRHELPLANRQEADIASGHAGLPVPTGRIQEVGVDVLEVLIQSSSRLGARDDG